jgi:hypothetical protein
LRENITHEIPSKDIGGIQHQEALNSQNHRNTNANGWLEHNMER